MSAHTFIDVQAVPSGSNLVSHFDCNADEAVSLQITKTTTGSFIQNWRLETSNHVEPVTQGPFTGSAHNGLWSVEQGPHSGTLMTGSSTQASILVNLGNINARFIRAIIPVYTYDTWKVAWHGKGSGR